MPDWEVAMMASGPSRASTFLCADREEGEEHVRCAVDGDADAQSGGRRRVAGQGAWMGWAAGAAPTSFVISRRKLYDQPPGPCRRACVPTVAPGMAGATERFLRYQSIHQTPIQYGLQARLR